MSGPERNFEAAFPTATATKLKGVESTAMSDIFVNNAQPG